MTRIEDPLDELAALFLTDADRSMETREPSTTVTIELALVGHLPVRAALWLGPYADAVARRAGPLALLRLEDEVPHLQLMRAPGDLLTAGAGAATLRQTIEALRPTMGTWIIRPPVDADLADLVAAAPDRLTVLSGADEAAVVGAYQLIKKVAAAAERATRPVPPMTLAVLGCDKETAQAVLQRLNRTTRAFLGVELSLALSLPRIDGGLIESAYRQFRKEPCPSAAEVTGWIRQAAPAEAPATAPPPPVEAHRTPDPPRSPEPPIAPAAAADPVAPAQEAPPEPAEPAESPAQKPRRPFAAEPRSTVEIEPKQPCTPREPDRDGQPVPLAHHAGGLEVLPVRCPGAERVELAVDGAGRLHLLGREPELRRMQVVQRWAFEHRELLALAWPEGTLNTRPPLPLHLFADQPLELADLHGSDIHLHVLAPVKVADGVGWYTARLNRV